MESSEGQNRMPLAQVVSDCAKRWFQDTLKEAKAGDTTMQVLVGQMYFSGYGVSRDVQRVNPLIFKFSFSFRFLNFCGFLLLASVSSWS